jgi:hypothetical protein
MNIISSTLLYGPRTSRRPLFGMSVGSRGAFKMKINQYMNEAAYVNAKEWRELNYFN